MTVTLPTARGYVYAVRNVSIQRRTVKHWRW